MCNAGFSVARYQLISTPHVKMEDEDELSPDDDAHDSIDVEIIVEPTVSSILVSSSVNIAEEDSTSGIRRGKRQGICRSTFSSTEFRRVWLMY